jgi:uncharacterized protein (DUF1501 family)
MAITRRQFLKRTGILTAGATLGPGLFANPFVRQALAFQNKYFIVLFLDGGNDGLNTVVPYDNGGGTLRNAYVGHRETGAGGLQLSQAQLGPTLLTNLALGNDGKDPNTLCQLALHPGFADDPGGTLPDGGLKYIYDAGRVAVIQGCGYPDYSLSHEQSRVIWETGNPLSYGPYTGTGWVGRYLVGQDNDPHPIPPPYSATDIPGVNIADSVVGEFRNTGTSVLALQRLADFGFPYDYDYGDDDAAKEAAFEALHAAAAASSNPTLKYVGNTGASTEAASQSYPDAHGVYVSDRGAFNTMYGGNGLNTSMSRGLREIAKIIYAVENGLVSGVNARFFQLRNGGYDTHSDQGAAETDGQHYALHSEVGNAIRLFWEDLATMGPGGSSIRNKVCILVWSEFSRRIPQNDNGTDHGSQGPMFVIGGAVNGGVYGNHPNINDAALDDDGNTEYRQDANGGYRSTDFRDVYGTVLTRWLNMSPATVLGTVLQLDSGSSQFYWTSANFNLGFLP